VRKRRPFSVTLLSLGVLIIVILNLIRFVEVFRQWTFLEGLPGVSPLYIFTTGLIWTIIWTISLIGLWFGIRRAPLFTLIAALFYAVYYWFDLVAVAQISLTTDSGTAWAFRLLFTFLLLGLTIYLSHNRKARAYFRRKV
jgi:hypothetical protein